MKRVKSDQKTEKVGSYVTVLGFTAEQLFSSDMLAYSGYKATDSNFVATGIYNPTSYAGILKADVQHRK